MLSFVNHNLAGKLQDTLYICLQEQLLSWQPRDLSSTPEGITYQVSSTCIDLISLELFYSMRLSIATEGLTLTTGVGGFAGLWVDGEDCFFLLHPELLQIVVQPR